MEDSTVWPRHVIDGDGRGADGVRLADIDGDGDQDIVTGWEESGFTRLYLQPAQAKVKSTWPKVQLGLTKSVEDAVFVDLFGNGRLAVLSSCEGKCRSLYLHQYGTLGPDKTGSWQQQRLAQAAKPARQWMYALPVELDGNPGQEVIVGAKGPKACIAMLWREQAVIAKHTQQVQDFRLSVVSPAGWVMSLWPRDVNGDGLMDVVVSDRRGKLRGCRWLQHPGVDALGKGPWRSHMMGAAGHEVMSMSLVDFNKDGLEDAITAVYDHSFIILERLPGDPIRYKEHQVRIPKTCGTARHTVAADIDGDGELEIACTCSQAEGLHGIIWIDCGKGIGQGPYSFHPISGNASGIKYDRLEMLDIDGDGDLDLLTCEEREAGHGLGVVWYENPFTR